MVKEKKCNHRWHFIREHYIDEWDSLSTRRKYQRGLYCKFICESCGETKWVLEHEEKEEVKE